MKMRTYVVVSALIFTLVALVHIVRLAQGWPVVLGTLSVPVWTSMLAVLVAGGAAIWGFSLLLKKA